MLTPGNKKLGGHLIWGFGLPSGTQTLCPGMTPVCRKVCYAVRMQQFRPQALRSYQHNLELSKRKGFIRRVRAFIISQGIRVVRIHTGGEFGNAKYAKKWQRIIERSPRVRFFTYTRAWRVESIRVVLEAMAELPNLQLWYSVDRDTGLPELIPPRVRIAWLMTTPDERPIPDADLVFRTQSLRKVPLSIIDGVPVCPAENGSIPSSTCDRCRICWRPALSQRELPLLKLPIVEMPFKLPDLPISEMR